MEVQQTKYESEFSLSILSWKMVLYLKHGWSDLIIVNNLILKPEVRPSPNLFNHPAVGTCNRSIA